MKFINQYKMENIKLSSKQLKALQEKIMDINLSISQNINYNLDYMKFYVHSDIKNIIILVYKKSGISGGMPFDEKTYLFLDENGQNIDYKSKLYNLSSWYLFLTDLKEVKLKDGKVIFI